MFALIRRKSTWGSFSSHRFSLPLRLSSRVSAHIHDLKIHQMCLLFALYFTAFSFSACYVFLSGNICMNNLILRNFMTWKKNEREKSERTFDIYSFLFIFIISFSLNSFSRTSEIVWRKNAERAFPILRSFTSFWLRTAPKLEAAGRFRSLSAFAIGQGRNTLAFLPGTEYNDNKLYCGRHVETRSQSHEIFSIFIT